MNTDFQTDIENQKTVPQSPPPYSPQAYPQVYSMNLPSNNLPPSVAESVEERESLLNNHNLNNPNNRRCARNEDDWCEELHSLYDSKVSWALFFGLLGLVIWPFAIIGYCIVQPVKKTVNLYHRHWCKVNSTYYLNLFVIIYGIIGTIVAIYFLTGN